MLKKQYEKYGSTVVCAVIALLACGASAATYTINPPAGTTTNVTQKYTGKNALTINTTVPPASGGTVYLNSANTHSGGTTLTYGTLVIQTADASELGSGTFTQNAGGTLRYAGPANGEWSKTLKGGAAQSDYVWQIDNDLTVSSGYTSGGYLIKTGLGTLTFTRSFVLNRSSYANNANRVKVLDFSDEQAPTKGFGNFTIAEGSVVIDTQDESVTNILANFDRNQTHTMVGACTTLDGTEKTGVLEIRSGVTVMKGHLAIGQCNGSINNSTVRLQPTVRVTGGKLAIEGTQSNATVIMGAADSSDGFSDLWNSPRLEVSGSGEFTCAGNIHFAYDSGADCVVQVSNGGFLSSAGFIGNNHLQGTRATSNLVEVTGVGSKILTERFHNDVKKSGQVTTVRVANGGVLEMYDFVNYEEGELHLVVDGGVLKHSGADTSEVQIPASMTSVKAGVGGFIADMAGSSVPVAFAKGIEGEGGLVVTNSSGAAGAHLRLAAASTYAGATTIADAYVELAASDAIPSTTALSLAGDNGALAVTNGEQTVASFKLGSDDAADSPTLAFARGSCLVVTGALTAGTLLDAPTIALYEEAGSDGMLSTPGEYVVIKARAEDISVLQSIASKAVLATASISCTCSASVEGEYAVLKVKGTEATDNAWASTTSGGAWSEPSNWSDSTIGAPRNGAATFPAAQAADVPVALDIDATVGSISFAAADPAYGYLVSGSKTLTFYSDDTASIVNNSGTNTIAAPVEVASAASIQTTAPGALHITGDIAGSGDISVNTHVASGAGEVSLSPSSGYTGGITTGSGRTVLDDLSFITSADQLKLGTGTLLYTGDDVTIPGFTVAAAANRQAIFESDADVTVNSIAVSGGSRGLAKYGTGTLTLLGSGTTTLKAYVAHDDNESANNVRSANGDSPMAGVASLAVAAGTFVVGETGVSANAPTIDASGSNHAIVIGNADSTGDATFVLNNGSCSVSPLRFGWGSTGGFAEFPTFTYRQNGGSLSTSNYTTSFDDASAAIGNVLIEINGGTLRTVSMRLGYKAAAIAGLETRIVVNGGSLVVLNSNMYPTWAAGAPHGYVVLNGGLLQVNSDYSASRLGADSDFYLNANGEFQISRAFLAVDSSATHAVFHANGGVFSPTNSASSMRSNAFTHFYVSTNGFVVNTAGITNDVQTYTINQPMLTDPELAGADGGLVKRGAGNLVLAAANTYTGPTVVEGGTLSLSGNGTFGATTNLVVASGAACNLGGKPVSVACASGAGVISNGTLTVTGTFGVSGGGLLTVGDDGVLTLAKGAAIDFEGIEDPDFKEGVAIASVSGTATLPSAATALNAGKVERVSFVKSGTIIYAYEAEKGLKVIIR